MATAQQEMIPAQEKARLKRDFRKRLQTDITLRLFTQRPSPIAVPGRDCRYCPQTQQLMEELAALSPKLQLETIDFHAQPQRAQDNRVSRIPAIAIDNAPSPSPDSAPDPAKKPGPSLKFYGLPLGYQLPALIDAIKSLSRGATRLSPSTRKQLRRINRPVHLQVFVTPASELAAGMSLLAYAMSIENPRIAADIIESEEFPELARRYAVRQVPLTIINELSAIPGMISEAELLAKTLQAGVE